MGGSEWSLVSFTLLVQAAVGVVITAAATSWYLSASTDLREADRICRTPLLVAAAGFAAGVAVSFMHLGSPLHAIYAVSNLGSSWLSREVMSELLFAAAGGAVVAMHSRGWGSAWSRRLAAVLATATGLALVYSMARVYMLDTVPPWNRQATAASFFTTAALLGVAVVAASLRTENHRAGTADRVRRTLVVLALALIGLRLMTMIATSMPVGAVTATLDEPTYPGWLPLFQALLLVAAAALLGRVLISVLTGRLARATVIGSAVLVGASEIVGRVVFYGSYWRVGI